MAEWLCPLSSFFPTTCPVSSVSRRDASPEVQRPLQNEHGDNLAQSKNDTISTLFFFSFSACSKADGRCRSTVLNWSKCLSLPI